LTAALLAAKISLRLESLKLVAMKSLLIAAVLLQSLLALGCSTSASNGTVLLGLTRNNTTAKCAGYREGLCGPKTEMMPIEIAGVFATEPECQGLKLRALTEEERKIPSNQLPLLFDLFYEGRPHTDVYQGTGEDEGWRLSFNGPNGHVEARVKTERDAVRGICVAAKGKGGKVDKSLTREQEK
jgi:hypothetical protein